MLPINHSTAVTFASGRTDGIATLLGTVVLNSDDAASPTRAAVLTETPFHPLDHQWPDQPGDTGTIETDGRIIEVTDSIVGAVEAGSREIFAGPTIPARRGDVAWHWLVLHVLADGLPESCDGSSAVLRVGRTRRLQLSASHTACHLSGFALNAALKGSWRKKIPTDSLNNPDFDSLALAQSRIFNDGFRDRYRIGRGLRKQGFDRDSLQALLPSLGGDVSWLANSWLRSGGRIRLICDGADLADIRTWECDLPEGTARLQCGGTHLQSLGGISEIMIAADLNETGDELEVTGKVRIEN
jgi:alanyl-tRNA synthetase